MKTKFMGSPFSDDEVAKLMIQKTLVTDNTDKLLEYVQGLKETPEYKSSGEKLVVFSAPADSAENIEQRNALLSASMPDAKIVGMTTTEKRRDEGDAVPAEESYSFLLMDRARADLFFYDCGEMTVQEAGRQCLQAIRGIEDTACVLVFSAGLECEIEQFIMTAAGDGVSDVPILGAQSGGGRPCLCGSFFDGRTTERGVAAVVFHGPDLHIRYNYDMGWKAIGREMTVTGTDGANRVTGVDHIPPTEVYRKYLGVEPDAYFAENVREFPFITFRGEREVVRTPIDCGKDGSLHFIAKINEGDKVRLSYANPKRLMENTRLYADSMRGFDPQALFLVVCENRLHFLNEQAASDVAAYQSFMPQTSWIRGRTAILLDRKGGGVVNSAVVSVGFREGPQNRSDAERSTAISPDTSEKGVIPLERRLAMLLEKTAKDMEDMAVEANAANAAKSEFLSMMAHDMATSVNAVIGMNGMILRENAGGNVPAYAENVQTASLSLLGLINKILDFSKNESTELGLNLTQQRPYLKSLYDENPLKELTEETDSLLPDWLRKVPTLHTEMGLLFCGGPQEYLDALSFFAASIPARTDELERLFLKADYENYTIKVHSLKSIAKALGATKLSALAAEMEAAGKAGDIESIRTGTGTLLAVYRGFAAPLARLADSSGAAEQNDAATEKRHTILLVDDDEDFLTLVSRWLKRKYAVTAVNSGKKALEYLETERPELVLLDYEMPEMTGADVLQIIRETPRLAGLPVVFLTGTEDGENVKRAEGLRPEGFLTKTMGKSVLLMGIAAFFD